MPDTAPVANGTAHAAPEGRSPRVGIIGCGLAGIAATIFVREKLGIEDIIGIERHPAPGGNWVGVFRDSYPGLACDVPAHVYSYSFALNPDWSRPFPPQTELLVYIQSVAKRFDVEKYFTFNRRHEKAEWLADEGVWRVTYHDLVPRDDGLPATKESQVIEGSTGHFEVNFLFNTSHATNEPGLPLIPGAVEGVFEGDWWHSMRWPRDGIDRLMGKRVALVGCAAAAVQLVPEIAAVATSLAVYHRTPNHVVERPNEPYPEEQKKRWRENPLELRSFRAKFEYTFAKNWHDTAFREGSDEYKKTVESARRNLETNIKDPKLREILWPTFHPWCRRVLFHDQFYPALNRPNVELVQERIVRIEKDGIVTALQDPRDPVPDEKAELKKREFDVIIYATGWAITGGKPAGIPILGVGGIDYPIRMMNIDEGGLENMEMQQYFGVMLDKFPNFFTPGNALGLPLYSVIEAIETHIDFACKVIGHAIRNGIKAISPTHEAVLAWCKRIDDGVKGTPTGTRSSCSGYYAVQKADGTETRRIYFPGMPSELAAIMRYPVWSDFEATKADRPWIVPQPPKESMLDMAYSGIHIVG
ncbi:hypothetical protein DFJ74DRAFT_726035 [Hyaloraphidium curvatum]|nr:hypothetical protein DFJ74DRAFT_726035 [Hyaloraphidium curvatum]